MTENNHNKTSKKRIINISKIVGITPKDVLLKRGAEMNETGILENAYIDIEDGLIVGFGSYEKEHQQLSQGVKLSNGDENIEIIDAEGGMVLPSFCDSHTHIVWAGMRDREFLDKINGLSYEEIAQNGGGILNSSDLLHNTSEEELYEQAMERVHEVIAKGSGAIEIKSGYGLTTEDELKMLRVIKRIKDSVPAVIKSTFLGAHAVGRAYAGRQSAYVDLICKEMIPLIANDLATEKKEVKNISHETKQTKHPQACLADFVDVFCDKGFFTVEETDKILKTGAKFGLRPKIHANELAVSGGVQVGVLNNALSVDHLERTTDAEIKVLKNSDTMPTMLPGASFFLGMPYSRAKDYIKAGLPVALASDYNPGSSPSGDMRFVMALGCIKMKLTPIEALNACTLNSAYAMGVSDITGSIAEGKLANLIITKKMDSLNMIPYCHHTPFINKVLLKGEIAN